MPCASGDPGRLADPDPDPDPDLDPDPDPSDSPPCPISSYALPRLSRNTIDITTDSPTAPNTTNGNAFCIARLLLARPARVRSATLCVD